jgi:hypothetical protein
VKTGSRSSDIGNKYRNDEGDAVDEVENGNSDAFQSPPLSPLQQLQQKMATKEWKR